MKNNMIIPLNDKKQGARLFDIALLLEADADEEALQDILNEALEKALQGFKGARLLDSAIFERRCNQESR